MSFDAVDLLMDVEKEFDIKIEDEDAVALESIGDLAEYITRKIHGGLLSSFPCMTAKAFYMFRRQLMSHLPLQERQIVPKARLKDLIPRNKRIHIWNQCRIAGLHLPSLNLPLELFFPVIVVGVVFGLIIAVKVHLLAMFVAIFAVGALGMWLLERLIRLRDTKTLYCFPAGCDTVADLIRQSFPPIDKLKPLGPIDPDVFEKVKSIVADNSGERKENLTPATRFVADLGF